jgi:hypothetical protein
MGAGIIAIAQAFTNAGTGTSRFFVATESMLSGSTSAANVVCPSCVTNGQADVVASGCSTCRAGANWDTAIPISGANRQTDGTHLNGSPIGNGLSLAVAADVTILTNCKNTSC